MLDSEEIWLSWARDLTGRDLPAEQLRDAIRDEVEGLRGLFDERVRAMLAAAAARQPFDFSGLTATGAADLLAGLDEMREQLVILAKSEGPRGGPS